MADPPGSPGTARNPDGSRYNPFFLESDAEDDGLESDAEDDGLKSGGPGPSANHTVWLNSWFRIRVLDIK